MFKYKKGDEVIITSGKDKGKKAKIDKLLPKDMKVFLPGLNVSKRHLKKRDEKVQGGIIEFSKPIPVSKIAYICHKCSKPSRIGFKIIAKKKQRICKKCGSVI
jgi:large subunit ribosomal protein L24